MGLENLKKEMAELDKVITKNKIDIADLFVDIYNAKPNETLTFDDFLNHIREMEKMPPLLAELEKNEQRYYAMLDSRILIEKADEEEKITQS